MDFFDKYTGDPSFRSDTGCSDEDGVMETFGVDLERVVAHNETNPRKVWTIVDHDEGDGFVIIAGYHYVNRFLYLISNEEWEDEYEEYEW
jgi:hypothetical protein